MNSSSSRRRFSATASSFAMCVAPVSGSTVCSRPARKQRRRETQRVGDDDVVIAQAVDEHQRADETGGIVMSDPVS